MKESDLYLPLKRFLEAQGYEVKGEVHACDVLAVRGDEEPVIVELKLSLNLDLVLQAVDRLAITPKVYVGVPQGLRILARRRKPVIKLLRRLGLGLAVIDVATAGVEILLDPGEYRPRPSKHRRGRLLGEFAKRVGDPNLGGAATKQGRMTAYRQRAIKIARYLESHGPTKAARVAAAEHEPKAGDILSRDVYGWFDRTSRGIYELSPRGRRELAFWRDGQAGRRSGSQGS